MAAPDTAFERIISHFVKTLKYLVTVSFGFFALGNIEAEHSYVLCADNASRFDAALELIEVGLKLIGYADFAETRADSRNAYAIFIEYLFHIFCLLCGDIRNISVVNAAQLYVSESVRLQSIDLI